MQFNIPEEFKRSSGIYVIRNSIDNRVYVGSAIRFNRRCWSHKSELLANTHHSKRLQNFVNKYGVEVLSFNLILVCDYDRESIIRYEQNFIDLFQSAKQGYGFNIMPYASGSNGSNIHGVADCKTCKRPFKKDKIDRYYCSNRCFKIRKCTITCLTCKKEVIVRKEAARFCSRECERNLVVAVKNCLYCGKEFQIRNFLISGKDKKEQLTCSLSCGQKYRFGEKVRKVKHCLECNKEFLDRTGTERKSKYCSRICADKNQKGDKSRLWVDRNFNCLNCKKQVSTTHGAKKFCSKACNSKYLKANPGASTRTPWNKKKRIHLEPVINKKGQYLIPF